MGIMDWLFGRDRGSGGDVKVEKQQQAIATLRKQLNKLDQQSKKFQRQSEEQKAVAKQMLKSGNKAGAKQALTRSNIYMQKFNKMANTQLNLQTQIDTISEATAAVEVVEALKVGVEVVAGVMETVDAVDVESTMVEMEEQRDQLDLMSEALADTTSIEMGLEGDLGDSIDDQLAAMELEIQGDLPDAGIKVATPTEPEAEKKEGTSSELEKELEALKNELDTE